MARSGGQIIYNSIDICTKILKHTKVRHLSLNMNLLLTSPKNYRHIGRQISFLQPTKALLLTKVSIPPIRYPQYYSTTSRMDSKSSTFSTICLTQSTTKVGCRFPKKKIRTIFTSISSQSRRNLSYQRKNHRTGIRLNHQTSHTRFCIKRTHAHESQRLEENDHRSPPNRL